MKGNFKECMQIVFKHEGGYSDHPDDPGGRTNYGITEETWRRYGDGRDVRRITRADAERIYRRHFWDPVRGDELPAGLDLCVFDFAVNSGPARAVGYLQRLVRTQRDGSFGPQTLRAVRSYVQQHGAAAAIRRFQALRERYFRAIVRRNSDLKVFLKGWLKHRVNGTLAAALAMAAKGGKDGCAGFFGRFAS